MKYISILGSTGSIGTQTLDVVRDLKNIKVKGLSANKNIDLLEKQIREFRPEKVAVMDERYAKDLRDRVRDMDVDVHTGMDGLIEIATMDIEVLVTSIVGMIGLIPTLHAIDMGTDIALANKETLVSAGELVMKKAREKGVTIYPVDSEHSAIFQCLEGNGVKEVEKILLTASGGPFRELPYRRFSEITIDDALKHPNWSMGKKITVDSATMMNKGLELIEAKWLFGVDIDNIQIVVHKESIIHSMVEYVDGSIIAQLGCPNMRVPIQYALTYPQRIKNNYERLDFYKLSSLSFEKPDMDKFKCLKLAIDAIKLGGTMPAVMNAANEELVYKFINEEISFMDIPSQIEDTMNKHKNIINPSLDDILESDTWARENIRKR